MNRIVSTARKCVNGHRDRPPTIKKCTKAGPAFFAISKTHRKLISAYRVRRTHKFLLIRLLDCNLSCVCVG